MCGVRVCIPDRNSSQKPDHNCRTMANSEQRHSSAHVAHASSAIASENAPAAICVGDMISLFVEDLNGFVSADGFTEDSLNVKCLRSDEICVPRFESCVFQVQVKQNYHAKVELETFLEQHGVTDASRADEELTVKLYKCFLNLCAKVEEEQKHNDEDAHIYFGRELRHSMPVQLLHVKSQKVFALASPTLALSFESMLAHTKLISFLVSVCPGLPRQCCGRGRKQHSRHPYERRGSVLLPLSVAP